MFMPVTFDRIVGSIKKQITQLEELAAQRRQEASFLNEKAIEMAAQADLSHAEADHASAVALNFKSILNIKA